MHYTKENKSKFYERYIYDILYWIIADIIFMNIIVGLFLDTFRGTIIFIEYKNLSELRL